MRHVLCDTPKTRFSENLKRVLFQIRHVFGTTVMRKENENEIRHVSEIMKNVTFKVS